MTTPATPPASFFDRRGKQGLVIGIANDESIAYGCARAMRALGADLAITYLNQRAEPFVRPLAEQLESAIVQPCDVETPGDLEAVFAAVRERFDLLADTARRAPQQRLVTIDEVGSVPASLVGDWSRAMTGNVVLVDGGSHVIG